MSRTQYDVPPAAPFDPAAEIAATPSVFDLARWRPIPPKEYVSQMTVATLSLADYGEQAHAPAQTHLIQAGRVHRFVTTAMVLPMAGNEPEDKTPPRVEPYLMILAGQDDVNEVCFIRTDVVALDR